MNVRINIILYPFLLIAFMLTAGISFEVSWGKFNLADLPYKTEIFYALTILSALLFLLKAVSRWMGASAFSGKVIKQAIYTEQISKQGIYRIFMYNLLEGCIYMGFGVSFHWLIPQSEPLAVLMYVMAAELILFIVTNLKRFKIVVTGGSIMFLARQLHIMPFNGIKKVEKDFNEWFFTYKNGKVKKLPLIFSNKASRPELLKKIREQCQDRDIFFSDNMLG